MRYAAVLPIILLSAFLGLPGRSASQTAFTSSAAKPGNEMAGEPHTGGASKGNEAITLDVVVTDKSGAAVAGLGPNDFKVFDSKQPRDLTSFHPDSARAAQSYLPVQLILLVDAVNSGVVETDIVREELTSFLKRDGGELALPTSFIFLTDKGAKVEGNGTRDGNELLKVLNDNVSGLRTVGRAGGSWEEAERRAFSLQALSMIAAQERKIPGRKLLAWISPGWPSFAGSSWMKSDKDNRQLFSEITSLSTELRESRITIYSVDPQNVEHIGGNQFGYRDYLKGVSNPKQTEYGDLLLQVLAVQSGGQVAFGSNDLSRLIDQCIADARSFYVLSFNATPAKVVDEYHELSVEIGKPGLVAHTRTGYYGQP
jgi:VWFA-related protein